MNNTLNLRYVGIAVVGIVVVIVGAVVYAHSFSPTSSSLTASSTGTTLDTNSLATTSATTTPAEVKPVTVVKKPVVIKKTTTVTTTTVTPKPPVVAQTVTVTPTPTGTEITKTPYTVTNTIKVTPIALLFGGTTHTGALVPVSYLQITNQTETSVTIKGFTVRQQGTAPDAAVIGFSSVDGSGTSRASSGGTEGSGVLSSGTGYVPSTAIIGPGQMKLFTLKAQLSSSAQNIGTSLALVITGVDAGVALTASLPIQGTNWTISQ